MKMNLFMPNKKQSKNLKTKNVYSVFSLLVEMWSGAQSSELEQ